MRAVFKTIFTAVLGAGLLALASQALACNTGCPPPAPPTPPHNPNPPGCHSGCGGGDHGHHGGGNTDVNVNVNVKASASAASSAFGFGNSGASYGGGYGNWSQTPGNVQNVGGLAVETGDAAGSFESYSEQQSFTKQTIIQASCIDDTGVPHPASQVFQGRDIANDYVGEVYRCIAGTHMQWTYADYSGTDINFDGGKNMTCDKNQALWFEHGQLTCKVQIQQRQCNERSLLRRFGVGIKILTLTRTETITKQRQVAVQQSSASSGYMVFDGGVGGFVQ